MSRRMNSNSRGRQLHTAPTRGPQIRFTSGGKTGKKNGAANTATVKTNNKKRQRLPSFSEADSTTSGTESDVGSEVDDESEEADDESEDPEADALSQFDTTQSGAGPKPSIQESVELPELGEWAGFPDMPDDQDPYVLGADFEKTIFDSDDDMVYERVNEVSDSEHEDDETLERAEADLLLAEFNEDLTSHFANQIDGMSAYGFGDDSDEEGSISFPFSSSDEANESHGRHVRFEEHMNVFEQRKVGVPYAFAVLGHSPTMTRALLPSALPDDNVGEEGGQEEDEPSEDEYDSDATEELEAPAQAWQMSSARRSSKVESSPSVPAAKRTPGQKGPVRGTFEDDGEKATAILDPSGKKLLFSDAHLIGGVFARKYGPSLPASPSNSFASAVLNESDSSRASDSPQLQPAQPLTTVDLMLSGLTSGEHASTNGQATGLPEAFMPKDTSFLNTMCPDLFGAEDDINPDGRLQLEDMIVFDADIDGHESNADSPMAASFLPDSLSAPSTPLAHLNHMNVTAFKRKAEPRFFDESLPTPMKNKFATPYTKKRRSTRNDSPYNSAHYQGVTPVQRITCNEHPSSPAPSSSHMHKRRRTMF